MKNKIVLILFAGILLLSCGSNEEQVENDTLFETIKSITDTLEQFEGTAFVGNLDGDCYMILKNGKQEGDRTEKVMRLRYAVVNPYAGTANVLDETYLVTNLVRKKNSVDSIGLIDPENYANDYIEGDFSALKSSIDGGAIVDGNGEGRIIFAIDSVHRKLSCIMDGTGNYTYQGSISLTPENHITVKTIFKDTIQPEEEEKILSGYKTLTLRSDDLIDLGNGSFKVQLSKQDLIEYTVENYDDYEDTVWYETKDIPLIKMAEIENISDNIYSMLEISERFHDMNHSSTREQEVLYYATGGSSSRDDSWFFYDVIPGNKHSFSFSLVVNPQRIGTADNGYFPSTCCDDEGHSIPHRLEYAKPVELFEDTDFLSVFNKASELPMIIISGRTENDYEDQVLAKIYLELVE